MAEETAAARLRPLPLVLGVVCAGVALFAPFGSLLGVGFGRRRLLLLTFGIVLLAFALPRARARMIAWWRGVPRVGPVECIALAAWLGLVTGFFEVLHQGSRRYVFGTYIRHTEMIMWAAPLVNLMVFTAGGLAVAVVCRCVPGVVNRFVWSLAAFGFAAWTQLTPHLWMSRFAASIVVIGVAVQGARIATKHWDRMTSLGRRSRPWLAAALAICFVTVSSWRAVYESWTVAGLPAAEKGAPNVLLVVLDTVRADHLSSYGHHRATSPNIDRLGEQGVTFDQVISTTSWTLPSHASMFTGRFPFEMSADWLTPLDDQYPTLAEALGDRGYVTGGFVGNLSYCSHITGLERGFVHYEDYYPTTPVVAWHTNIGRKLVPGTKHADKIRNDAKTVTDQFLEWLPGHGDRPFFAFLNYFDAHAIYRPPEGWDTKFGPRGKDLDRWYLGLPWKKEEMTQFVDAYDALIAYIDAELQRVIDHLDERGQLDNTLIVITGDHGEQFMEKNDLVEHGNSLYAVSLRVPLLIRWPGRVPAGVRVEDFVSIRDLPVTILDLLDLDTDPPFPGASLAALWSDGAGASNHDTPVLAEISKGIATRGTPHSIGDMKSLVVDGMQVIVNGDDTLELYDLRADPLSQNDLAATPEGAATAARLREMIEALTSENDN